MERRVFLAIVLSLLVLYAYQSFFAPPPVSPPAPAASGAAGSSDTPAAAAPSGTAEPVERPAEPPVPAVAAVVAETSEREIVVSTTKAEVVFTNRGGRVVNWRLKDYLENQTTPVDLVPARVPPNQPRPFSLEVPDTQLTRRANDSLYRVSGDTNGRVDATSGPATLVFEYEAEDGVRVRKEFVFEPDSYIVTFSATMLRGQELLNPTVTWGPGLGDAGALSAGGSFFTGNYVQPPGAIYHRDGEVERITADQNAETPTHEGDFLFAGIDDHYFIVSMIQPGRARLDYQPVTLQQGEDVAQKYLSFKARFENGPQSIKYFVGPKEFESLSAAHPQLTYAINFGIFRVLVTPLLQGLKWIHGYVNNWGWSIILLTIFINLVLFPFRHKSLVSMRKMQLIQPQVKAIQDRYADLKMTDPARQKMNTEIFALYREKGVNPASGCVPMLLMMPVLFAFYALLSQAIELRGAPFGFWIHDLSLKDPYYVTPLLMGGTMVWQQWLAPTSADPVQARMMMFMPIVFTAMFLGFPSGLAIYYLVSNLIQIGQQYFTNRIIGPPPQVAARPAAERRVKSVGSGRTQAAEEKK